MVVSSVCEVGCCCENKSMKKINAYVCHPDCESFIAELSESTKNTDLWTMSAPGVVILLLAELSEKIIRPSAGTFSKRPITFYHDRSCVAFFNSSAHHV